MPDEKLRLTSAVVVSKSFLKEQERRDHARERRINRFRQSESDDEDKSLQRDREHRSRRLGDSVRRPRRVSERDENEDRGNWKGHNLDNPKANRPSGPNRNSVFDRLDKGSIKSRLGQRMLQEDVEENVVTDPTDVPRGQRYFMHDDRDGPRGRDMRRFSGSRGRSRSPVWRHDMFEKVQQEENVDDDATTHDEHDHRDHEKPEEEAPRRRRVVAGDRQHGRHDTTEELPRRRDGGGAGKWRHDKFAEMEQEPKRDRVTDREDNRRGRRNRDY
ncbi:bcl-2-associated transcription factor 1 [Nematostella vectensis]|uniref:bcl-2-associated transcription factor 1 n=1 Tax=Nematostella vectensis TaxID=45351 RepID=UPI002076FA01|nr:bcl-2-associated transcription factor 1 [Nematostella vectensis]